MAELNMNEKKPPQSSSTGGHEGKGNFEQIIFKMNKSFVVIGVSEYSGDSTELIYLRARHYKPSMGRFLTEDTWAGNANMPMTFNKWNYVGGNPVNLTDPSGNFPPLWCQAMPNKALYEGCVDLWYKIEPINYFMLGQYVTGEKGCYEGPSEYRAPGYLEGTGLTIASPSIANWLFAVESVYDFATMEHDYYVNGSFKLPGLPGLGVSDFVWGGVGTQYAGYVYGFRTTKHINDEYPGAAFVGYLGISGGTGTVTREGIGVGTGFTGFMSATDPTIRGHSQYISVSLGYEIPIPVLDAGLGIIQMQSMTNDKPTK